MCLFLLGCFINIDDFIKQMSAQLLPETFPLKPPRNIKASEMHPFLESTHLPLSECACRDYFMWKPFSPKKGYLADPGPQ